jgi:hypothetical protein
MGVRVAPFNPHRPNGSPPSAAKLTNQAQMLDVTRHNRKMPELSSDVTFSILWKYML